MKYKRSPIIILYLFVLLLGVQTASAVTNIGPTDLKVLDMPLRTTTDSNYNFKVFEVYTEEANEYYAEFWLLPAKYADGTYTKYSVFVNDEFIGSITAHKDNWQAARIDGNSKIGLKKGTNVIAFAVPAPEQPSVETLEFSLTDKDRLISSSAYNSFIEKAAHGTSYAIPNEELYELHSSDLQESSPASEGPEFSVKHFSDVPLKYTFYSDFFFNEGDTINIETVSLSEHDVDILYLGEKSVLRPFVPNDGGQINANECSNTSGNFQEGFDLPDIGGGTDLTPSQDFLRHKMRPSYLLGSSEELQGLNWKGISVKSAYDQTNKISKTIIAPKTGIYFIRLRHRHSGQTGLATICVNKKYTYEDMPVSFTWVKCEIPSNGKEYGTMTFCEDPSKDDPILLIHGAAADRIVGFSDDADNTMQAIHELSNFDSHVLQEYRVKTSGISVCNYSSSDPESSCVILAGMDESLFDIVPESQLKPGLRHVDNSLNRLSTCRDVNITGSLEQSKALSITSQSQIRNVTIIDMLGNIICRIKGQDAEMSIPANALNLTESGIYIVRVETDKGLTSKKLFVK